MNPNFPLTSNPVAISRPGDTGQKLIFVFVQTQDGQVTRQYPPFLLLSVTRERRFVPNKDRKGKE